MNLLSTLTTATCGIKVGKKNPKMVIFTLDSQKT